MTLPEDRLTAYALNDPGLTADERATIELTLSTDPAARHAVEETRRLGALLTTSLTREQVTLTADVAATPAKPARRWPAYAGGLASGIALTLAVAAGVTTYGIGTDTKPMTQAAPQAEREVATGLKKTTDGMDPGAAPLADSLPNDAVVTGESGRTAAAKDEKLFGDSESVRDKLAVRPGLSAMSSAPAGPKPEPAKPATITSLTPAGMPAAAGFPGGLGSSGGSPGSAIPTSGTGGAMPAGRHLSPADSSFKARLSEKPGEVPSGEKRQHSEQLPKELYKTGVKPGYSAEAKHQSDERLRYAKPAPAGFADQQRFAQTIENRFTKVEGQQALSTFGVDVDTASYAIARNYLMNLNQLPPPNAVRLEEVVNYFPYQDKAPENGDPFAVTVEVAQCPWAPGHRLARIGLKAKPIATDKRPPSNLVFLIDVSGSMNAPDRLPLVKSSLKLLINQLGENDRVAMVVYAGTTGIVLDSTTAARKDLMHAALDRLEAGGSTNGAGGIQDAYAVAKHHFIKNGTNRVILCTDGDWNVGTTSTEALVAMIEEKRKTNIFLSVFGFGMGNLRDEMMVKLAGKGNGNYAYIDTIKEANKALVEQLSGTIVTVAKDVKIQVEFNPAVVQSYRLLGYEKRHLNAEDFHNDAKDAGEMGAGHVVTALYELIPTGGAAPVGPGEGLKYQPVPVIDVKGNVKATEAFTVKMRHKKPDADVSTYRELPVSDTAKPYAQASEDFRFSAAAASYAMLLRNSEFKGTSTFEAVIELAAGAMKFDPSGYRAEFLELARKATTLSGKP